MEENKTTNNADIVNKLMSQGAKDNYDALQSEYNPEKHKIFSQAHRPDKTVAGKNVEVTRLGFNDQKRIVDAAVAFLFTNMVKVNGDSRIVELANHVLKKNKAFSLNRLLARTLFSETEVAEYWYSVEKEDFWDGMGVKSKLGLRCVLFSQGKGDKLYPLFDEYGDMIAFSRQFKGVIDEKEVDMLESYTDGHTTRYANVDGEWLVIRSAPNLMGKISVGYYSQDNAEWSDVQSFIERKETLISDFGDTNSYFGSPILALKGKVLDLPEKSEQGKVIRMSEGAEAGYITWSHAPEAIKLEYNILSDHINAGSSTPPNNLFGNLQSIGDISGVALKLMFQGAYMKANNKLELFDEMFRRRASILKSYLSLIDPSVKNQSLEFDIIPYLPANDYEVYQQLTMLSGNKPILSKETAMEYVSYIKDVSKETERLEKEEVQDIGESFV